MNLNTIYSDYSDDIDAINEWVDTFYDKQFSKYFAETKELFKRIQSKTHSITDEELTYILIDLPINLFEVSESLNKLRLDTTAVKLKNKQKELELVKASSQKTATKKSEEAQSQMIEENLLLSVFQTLCTRVDSEISMSKELIMGAKKVWDARKKGENSMPVGELNTDNLPDYVDNKRK